ncbi:TPA: hypothetical protein ENS27_19515 [bacterium]|nr:hypothetical protein [bacterium]
MTYYRCLYISIISIFAIIYISGCGFDDPYVPDSVGSSTISGKIIPEPSTDVNMSEVILRGKESVSTVSDINGKFKIDNIIPGNYVVQIQKSPYIQTDFPINVSKDTKEELGEIKVKLLGAISATIPTNKLGTLYGEFEIVVYVNGVPRVPEKNSDGEFMIDLRTTETDINIRTVTKTIVYIDGTPYSAKVLDDGEIFVEFVPPGIYSNVSIKLNTPNATLPVISVPIEVKSGEIRSITLES